MLYKHVLQMAHSTKKRINISIGQRIRKHRKKQGISQEDLGEMVGLSRVSIVNIEYGRNGDMPISHVYLFAKVLGVGVRRIIAV